MEITQEIEQLRKTGNPLNRIVSPSGKITYKVKDDLSQEEIEKMKKIIDTIDLSSRFTPFIAREYLSRGSRTMMPFIIVDKNTIDSSEFRQKILDIETYAETIRNYINSIILNVAIVDDVMKPLPKIGNNSKLIHSALRIERITSPQAGEWISKTVKNNDEIFNESFNEESLMKIIGRIYQSYILS